MYIKPKGLHCFGKHHQRSKWDLRANAQPTLVLYMMLCRIRIRPDKVTEEFTDSICSEDCWRWEILDKSPPKRTASHSKDGRLHVFYCYRHNITFVVFKCMDLSVLYKLRSICLLCHNHWCLHVSSKQWGCVCIRVSNTPHTELRDALIDSRIVFSRTAMSISEWLDVSETPSLPQILGLTCRGMQDTIFWRLLSPYCRISTHGCRMRPSFGHPPENTHRTRFTEVTKACRSYAALLCPRKKRRQFTARYG